MENLTGISAPVTPLLCVVPCKLYFSENKTPKVVEGVRKLVEFRVELQEDLAEFLLTLPFEKLGIWAVGGWDACIPKSSMARSKLNQFFKEIEINSTDAMIKAAAKKAQV